MESDAGKKTGTIGDGIARHICVAGGEHVSVKRVRLSFQKEASISRCGNGGPSSELPKGEARSMSCPNFLVIDHKFSDRIWDQVSPLQLPGTVWGTPGEKDCNSPG